MVKRHHNLTIELFLETRKIIKKRNVLSVNIFSFSHIATELIIFHQTELSNFKFKYVLCEVMHISIVQVKSKKLFFEDEKAASPFFFSSITFQKYSYDYESKSF